MLDTLQVIPCKFLWFELPPCVRFPEKDFIFMFLRLHTKKTKAFKDNYFYEIKFSISKFIAC